MAQDDDKAGGAGSEHAEGTVGGVMSALNMTSKNIQAIAGEMLEISKQSFEHTTQTMEKLRGARGVDEIMAIQTNFVKEAFEHAAQHAQKFSELMTVFPAQITKTYRDAWLKSMDSTLKVTEKANETAAENIDRVASGVRKASKVSERRETA
jgi:hypothetical protein